MSTPEILLLLKLLAKSLKNHPEWFSVEELATAQRWLDELKGV